jgi:hypothetical protein
VLHRIEKVSGLFEHVAAERADPASYSIVTYGPHAINNDRGTYPEIAARTLGWAERAETALARLEGLARHGALPAGYSRAAQLECMLAGLAERLTGSEGRPVLVTAGRRPPHPPRLDGATRIIPCPQRNDADEILRYLHDRFPGMKVGEITDSARFADSPQSTWQQALRRNFGSDATSDGFSTSDFAIRLGLTGQPVRLVPLPVMVV